jgi:hypothetical protein
MAEIHFRPMDASQSQNDVTVQFLVGGEVIDFAGIFHLSGSVQLLIKNFMLVQWLNFFFQFFEANMTLKIFFANLDTPKRHFFEKICVD